MKDCCVINVALGPGWYPRGQQRLKESLWNFNPDLQFMHWRDALPPGCPEHQQIPYAFKPYAFKAARAAGFRKVLWVDAAAWAIRDVSPVFEDIARDGCYFQNGGYSTGEWCSDAALETLGLTRDEAMDMGHIMACILGLDFENDAACKFLDQWMEYANDGVTFPGAWRNENNEVSTDPRVKGHRHDQTAASVVSLRLGMPWHSGKVRLQYKMPDTQGPKDDDVCFMSAGM